MFCLRTVQGSLFKNIMESMKDNLNDCNVRCTPQGLVSTGLDACHVSLAHFKVFADGVEHYECDGEYVLGINTQYFHRFLKNVNHHDLLELRYQPSDPDNLMICIKSPESGSRTVSMRLLNMAEEEDMPQDMPEHDYSMVLTMASSELQKVVREMIPNGETLRVVCELMEDGRQQVSFQSRGDAGDMTYFVDMEQQDTEVEDFERIDMELDIIADLIGSNAAWLAPFPIVFDIEYFVYPEAKHIGKGDVVFCDPEYTHFIVVELKRSERHLKKLLHQMYYYRDHFKYKQPHCLVDCAAVADGKLIRYATDDMQTGDGMYFSNSFKGKLRAVSQFALKYLWSFVRASPLSPRVKIYLKQGQPISLKFEMGTQEKHSLGEAIFLLAPKVDDDDFPEPYEAPAAPKRFAPAAEEPKPAKRAKHQASREQSDDEEEDLPEPVSDVGVWHEAEDDGMDEPEWD